MAGELITEMQDLLNVSDTEAKTSTASNDTGTELQAQKLTVDSVVRVSESNVPSVPDCLSCY